MKNPNLWGKRDKSDIMKWTILGFGGWGLILWQNWILGIGVFCMVWAHNIEWHPTDKENL